MKKHIIFIVLLITQLMTVMCVSKSADFLAALNENRLTCSDSTRTIRVEESGIYSENTSSADAYVPLFNYLAGYRTEKHADSIRSNIYRMFTKYPEKQTEFENYLDLLPPEEQNAIIAYLVSFFPDEFVRKNDISGISDAKIVENLFLEKFPFLNGREIDHELLRTKFASSIQENLTSCFLEALKRDRTTYSDSIRCIQVVESKIYNENSSTMQDYIPLFNYLIEHISEEYSEGIGGYLYEMFTKYPEKQLEFDNYLTLLPHKEQKKVIISVTEFLIFEHRYELETAKIMDLEVIKQTFWEKFPFLSNYKDSHNYIDFYFHENPSPL